MSPKVGTAWFLTHLGSCATLKVGVKGEFMSDPIQDETKPTGKTPGTLLKKKLPKLLVVMGFSYLAVIILAPIIIVGGLVIQSQHYGEVPSPPASVSKLQPKSDTYLASVQSNKDLLPSFGQFMTVVFNRGLPCLETYESPDACLMTESKSFKSQNTAAICEEVLQFAKELGATEDSIPGDESMIEISEKSTSRCEAALHSYPRSVGWGWFSPAYFLQGITAEGTPFAIQLSMEQDSPINALEPAPPANRDPKTLQAETFKYSLITATNFDTPDPIDTIPDYSKPMVQVAALLDTVAYYRRSNPDLPIFDPTFTGTIIEEYKSSFRFDGDVEPYIGVNGEAHWIHLKNNKGFEICVSTGASRAELEVVTEAGMSSMLEMGIPGNDTQLIELAGLRSEVSSVGAGHPFGSYIMGPCK